MSQEHKEQPGSIEIPEHWRFWGKGRKNFRVDQIDLEKQFLSYHLTPGTDFGFRIVNPLVSEDCFFNREGEIVTHKQVNVKDVSSQEISFQWKGDGDLPASLFLNFRKRDSPYGLKNFSSMVFFLGNKDMSGFIFHFERSDGDSSRLVSLYLPEDARSKQRPSGYGLGQTKIYLSGEKTNLWIINSSWGVDLEKPNEVIVRSGKDNDPFRITWKEAEGRLVVSDTQLGTGKTRVVQAPLFLDMRGISDRVFSKPPYPKKQLDLGENFPVDMRFKSFLDVPWVGIKDMLGVNLSYTQNQEERT